MRSPIKSILLAAVAVSAVLSSCATHSSDPLSVWLARSEMKRVPDAINLDFQPKPKWDYSGSIEAMAILRVAEVYEDQAMADYAKQWADTMLTSDGDIIGYNPEKYNIDHICPGKFLLRLYNHTGDKKYLTAAGHLFKQYETHPRTSEGGLWHKKVYPNQMWLDGLYMGAPFIAEYGMLTDVNVAEDMARQFVIVANHTRDDSTRLYRHAWDESHSMFWADSVTGRSQHAWGRANGWFMMGMVDILEFIPEGTAYRDSVLNILNGLVSSVMDYRDKETGMWYQVLDCPGREGNYVESTCSAMFIYSMLKASRLGYIPSEYRGVAEEAFSQFVHTFIKKDGDEISITSCCAVAGLGGKDMRDGSFDYYIHEPVRDNDPKAVGPFLLACLELGL